MWIPEAVSCLTTNDPVNKSINKWPVDTGCGYDMVSKKQADSVNTLDKEGINSTDVSNSEWGDNSR